MTHFFSKDKSKQSDSWQWQIENSIRQDGYNITPYTNGLIDHDNPNDPLAIMYNGYKVSETIEKGESPDPLDELNYIKTPHIVHKYKDRVLFLVSTTCASYCKYCTRSRLAGTFIKDDYRESFAYLRANPDIKQVVISGGDPLMLSDEKIANLLKGLRKIPSVEVIRIATKTPTTLPMRITDKLVKIIAKARPVIVSVHICHPNEITPEFAAACDKMNRAGIMLNSQTVLLKNVNDDVETLKQLYQGITKNYVIPYALYSCDPIRGGKHYRVPLHKGAKLIAKLRQEVSGTNIPMYVADIPYAPSKILINKNCIEDKDKKFAILRDECGNKYKYINK